MSSAIIARRPSSVCVPSLTSICLEQASIGFAKMLHLPPAQGPQVYAFGRGLIAIHNVHRQLLMDALHALKGANGRDEVIRCCDAVIAAHDACVLSCSASRLDPANRAWLRKRLDTVGHLDKDLNDDAFDAYMFPSDDATALSYLTQQAQHPLPYTDVKFYEKSKLREIFDGMNVPPSKSGHHNFPFYGYRLPVHRSFTDIDFETDMPYGEGFVPDMELPCIVFPINNFIVAVDVPSKRAWSS